jgi:hypothetical protein
MIGSLLFGGMGQMGGGIGHARDCHRRALSTRLASPICAAARVARGRRRRLRRSRVRSHVVEAGAYSRSTAFSRRAGRELELRRISRGIAHIVRWIQLRTGRFSEDGVDVFFRLQAAWMTRDMSGMRVALTEEMSKTLQAQCDRLRAERRVNRLENIAVRSVDVTEMWQEEGHDFVTVRFLANLLDYTTDESGAQLVEGSRTEPVKFEEFWTFTRPVGPGAWRLSAIQQG